MDDLLSRIAIVLERQSFRMCVPPESDDTDIVLEECRDSIESLRQQLAAALAACEAKDAALKQFAEFAPHFPMNRQYGNRPSSGTFYRVGSHEIGENELTVENLHAAVSAIAIKPDASILKAHDEALIERCAEVCEEYQGSAETCAAAIRELKGKL